MWAHQYTPIAGSLRLSALCAALPVVGLLVTLAGLRKPAWMAALSGLAVAAVVAIGVYGMPAPLALGSVVYGGAQGLFPIGWVVFTAILLYNVSVETGQFAVVRASIANLTVDRRLQTLLIAFAFGAFIEGAAGFGTPVAVAAAMLAGLGVQPMRAAIVCLIANTAPVAFGSIGTPLLMLATVTGLPLRNLSADVGQLCAPFALIIPSYLMLVMGGWRALKGVLPAALVCGACFGSVQFLSSRYLGPELTDILSSFTTMAALLALFRYWKPANEMQFEGDAPAPPRTEISGAQLWRAWLPFILLVICVMLWNFHPLQKELARTTLTFRWPGLHRLILRTPPVTKAPIPYDAVYTFAWLAAPGTAVLIAAVLAAVTAGMKPLHFVRVLRRSVQHVIFAEATIFIMLGMAFLMNYSGMTGTLGLAFAATGVMFPFFGSLLGWVGVFLTGSDTSANALFGSLQVVTAQKLNIDAVLMASANSAGGVMGKMISLQNITVAVAATSLGVSAENRIFRRTVAHSIVLAAGVGVLAMIYAYVLP